MATITIYLKYTSALEYALEESGPYSPMGEETITGAKAGDTIVWTCADDSISKINNITVNRQKPVAWNWKDIWAEKPKATDNTKKTFSGVIVDTEEPADNPAYNAYDINIQTKSDGDKDIDPLIKYPAD